MPTFAAVNRDLWNKPIEGPRRAFLTTGARDKQIAAPIPNYHRQGLHFEHL